VEQRLQGDSRTIPDDYLTFAKKFPSLIHSCGLAQAVAFGLAKKQEAYLDDLAAVLQVAHADEITNNKALDNLARTADAPSYIRLSRNALTASSWLKRYAEAFDRSDDDTSGREDNRE
jgi:CRISPR-associated protein Cmr5